MRTSLVGLSVAAIVLGVGGAAPSSPQQVSRNPTPEQCWAGVRERLGNVTLFDPCESNRRWCYNWSALGVERCLVPSAEELATWEADRARSRELGRQRVEAEALARRVATERAEAERVELARQRQLVRDEQARMQRQFSAASEESARLALAAQEARRRAAMTPSERAAADRCLKMSQGPLRPGSGRVTCQ